MSKILCVLALNAAIVLSAAPLFTSTAQACTNSYDRASNGTACGGRASGCKSGGKGGYC